MRLDIVQEQIGQVPVLRLLGALDIATLDQFREGACRLLEQEAPAIAVDLAQVTFVDSSGMGALLAGKKRAMEKGVEFVLLDCPEPLQRLLDLVGLNRIIDFRARHELAERFPMPEPPTPTRSSATTRRR